MPNLGAQEIQSRIKKRRNELGMSFQDLAEKTMISKSTLQRYETGAIKSIPLSKLNELSAALQLSTECLLGLEGTKIENEIPYKASSKIPLIGSIACGAPVLADEAVEQYFDLPDGVRADFCLRCKGDSMSGARIFDGDIVFVKKQADVSNGEIAAVLIEDEATLKRLYKKKDAVVLMPENPAYEPMVYDYGRFENIRILGKAVFFLSRIV